MRRTKRPKKHKKNGNRVNAYQRQAIIEKAAQMVERRREEIAQILVEENGASHTKANIEITGAIDIMKELVTLPLRMHGKIMPFVILRKEKRVYYNPAGGVGIINPFNFPFHLTMRSPLPALATGNGVVIKRDMHYCRQ